MSFSCIVSSLQGTECVLRLLPLHIWCCVVQILLGAVGGGGDVCVGDILMEGFLVLLLSPVTSVRGTTGGHLAL
jgi:hypothetical protein